jgi:peptidoglycan/xylan/chitin deacetylase (PgdA/CDA1 family)
MSGLVQPTDSPRAPGHPEARRTVTQETRLSDSWRGRLSRSSLARPLARLFAGQGSCLMYHRICDDQQAAIASDSNFLPNQELVVSAGAFEQQMAFLARHYNCITLAEAIGQIKAGRLEPDSAIVTFDDGYLDNLTLALPILRKYQVPATVYVATGLVEHAASLWWYELEHLIRVRSRLHIQWQKRHIRFSLLGPSQKYKAYFHLNRLLKGMSPAEQEDFMAAVRSGPQQPRFNSASLMLRRRQLQLLAADPLITIGAHTHHHLVLSRLPEIRLRHEINRSRDLLQSWLERPITHLAYPFGGNQQAGKREFLTARELGFESAVTTRLGHIHGFHRKHLLALPRVAIGYQDCMERFEWKLSGLYCLARRPVSRIRI